MNDHCDSHPMSKAFEEWWKQDGAGSLDLDDMEAAQRAWNAALTHAAKVCEDIEEAKWAAYKTGHGPDRAREHTQGESNGAGQCARAIEKERDSRDE